MPKMTKEQALAHWRKMRKRVNPLPFMKPIPYRAEGSKYGACGIRIDGTPAFIDAVLSNLTDLLEGEGVATRLELSRNVVDGSTLGKSFDHSQGEVCYIRLHKRGGEGQIMQAIIASSRERAKATA